MRPLMVLVAGVALLSAGCAAGLARCGIDPGETTTRDQVHAAFGRPCGDGKDDGGSYEEFCYHGKVAENLQSSVLFLVWFYSFGLSDVYYVPCGICHMGWKTIVGYDLRFHYDEAGKVTKYTIDGLPGMEWPFKSPSPASAPVPTPN